MVSSTARSGCRFRYCTSNLFPLTRPLDIIWIKAAEAVGGLVVKTVLFRLTLILLLGSFEAIATPTPPQRLTQIQVTQRLRTLPGWTTNGKQLVCIRRFKDFLAAIAFVNRLVQPAEAAGHHPDLAISYNKVTISLTTHDAGGLTDLDFQVAGAIAALPPDSVSPSSNTCQPR